MKAATSFLWLRRALPAALISTTLASAPSRGQCPENCLEGDFRRACFTEAARDTTLSPCGGREAYDLRAGRLEVNRLNLDPLGVASGVCWCHYSLVQTADDFQITGLTPGTPVEFDIVLLLHAAGGSPYPNAYHHMSAYIVAADSTLAGVGWFNFVERDTVLRVHLLRRAGEPFQLSYRLSAGGCEDRAEATAIYRFLGLPQGADVTSCQGFNNDLSSVLDAPRPSEALQPLIRVAPNPANGQVRFLIDVHASSQVELSVFDVRGALVKTLGGHLTGPGVTSLVWDGMDRHGRPAPAGVYWARARVGERFAGLRFVISR